MYTVSNSNGKVYRFPSSDPASLSEVTQLDEAFEIAYGDGS